MVKAIVKISTVVEYLHNNGFIHGNISLNNVFFGQKVMFPIFLENFMNSFGHNSQSKINDYVYIAPERISYPSVRTSTVDIYSLGILLYQFLFCECPFFYCRTLEEMIQAKQKPLEIKKRFHLIPDLVIHIINKAIAYLPENRYQNIKQFQDDLSKLDFSLTPILNFPQRNLLGDDYVITNYVTSTIMNSGCFVYNMKNTKEVFAKLFKYSKEDVSIIKQNICKIMSLKHDNIYNITDYGICERNNRIYIVYEYISGYQSLKNITQQTPHEAIKIINVILSVIKHMYSLNYTHFHLSPLITFIRNYDVKIRLEPNVPWRHRASLGDLEQKFEYEPLEILMGKKNSPISSNIYRVGAIMFCLLSGINPFSEYKQLDKLYHAKSDDNYCRLGDLCPNLPQNIISIVEKAMAKEANNRYQSISGMKSDIDVLTL